MRAAFIAIAALALSGCSGTGALDWPVRSASAQQPAPLPHAQFLDDPESYYRHLVAAHPTTRAIRADRAYAPPQISPLRMSVAPQPGDWMTCLRVYQIGKKEIYRAIFIRKREIIEVRSGVTIDRCENEPYTPLPDIYVPPREPRAPTGR